LRNFYRIFLFLEKFPESFSGIIRTFNRDSIPNERIEHHRGVHQCFIRGNTPPDVCQCLHLWRGIQPFSHPYPLAVPAVCALAVHGNCAISARNRDSVFLFIALELECFHIEKIFKHQI